MIRPLQIVARDFFVTIQQSSERAISQMEVLNSLENDEKENENRRILRKTKKTVNSQSLLPPHVMAQATKHSVPSCNFLGKFCVCVKEGFYYDMRNFTIDVVNDEVIAAIEKEMKNMCKEGEKIYGKKNFSEAESH